MLSKSYRYSIHTILKHKTKSLIKCIMYFQVLLMPKQLLSYYHSQIIFFSSFCIICKLNYSITKAKHVQMAIIDE